MLLLQTHCAEVHRPHHDGDEPDEEREPAQVLPRQEVQAEGLAAKEDSSH